MMSGVSVGGGRCAGERESTPEGLQRRPPKAHTPRPSVSVSFCPPPRELRLKGPLPPPPPPRTASHPRATPPLCEKREATGLSLSL